MLDDLDEFWLLVVLLVCLLQPVTYLDDFTGMIIFHLYTSDDAVS